MEQGTFHQHLLLVLLRTIAIPLTIHTFALLRLDTVHKAGAGADPEMQRDGRVIRSTIVLRVAPLLSHAPVAAPERHPALARIQSLVLRPLVHLLALHPGLVVAVALFLLLLTLIVRLLTELRKATSHVQTVLWRLRRLLPLRQLLKLLRLVLLMRKDLRVGNVTCN